MTCYACKGPCCIDWQGNVKSHWWDKQPGYYKDEVKAALRRSSNAKPAWLQKGKAPTLAASSNRLRQALVMSDEGRCWQGPRAAEQYVAYRREQLGLSNEWPKETAVAA